MDLPPSAPASPHATVAAGWHSDPWGRFEYRYWDGAQWTEHVSKAGAQTVDPGEAVQPAVPAQAPQPQAADVPSVTATAAPAAEEKSISFFGARGRAKELTAEVEQLRARLVQLEKLGVLSVAELENRRNALRDEADGLQAKLEEQKRIAASEIQEQRRAAGARLEEERAAATRENQELMAELAELRTQVVTTREEAVLQEVGVYEYRHPLQDAVAYQAELKRLTDAIKTMTRKDGGAVMGSTNWTVNGSLPQGRAMVRDFSKLMLRAYNAEADNLVRGLKPYKLNSAVDRLTKVAGTIVRLGRTMDIRISDPYHQLRVLELELTADYLEKVAEQKEREREEKQRLREERQAQQEMERERAKLEKERQHHANALEALAAAGEEEAAERLRQQLADIDARISDVDYRAANIRAGYVYVISNIGSLGDDVVKIGMTRRLDPRDRVRELGDASVPFRFDVHALFFSKDAVSIEAELHRRFEGGRVNLVNRRREFFRVTPAQVKEQLAELTGEVLEFEELPEAVEYHQSKGGSPVPAQALED